MGKQMQERLAAAQAEAQERAHERVIIGQPLDDISRYAETTRHMIVFDVLDHGYPIGEKGDRVRVFLSDEGYTDALADQSNGKTKILRHARVKDGVLHYDTPGKAFE